MIYLIKNNTTGLIKIGISNDPQRRLKQLQTGNTGKLEIIKTYITKNDKEQEKRIHKILWQNKKRGEWFFFPHLDKYIELIDILLTTK